MTTPIKWAAAAAAVITLSSAVPPSLRFGEAGPFGETGWKWGALKRAYELNGNLMCCGFIDVSDDPIVTGRVVITPETEFNILDMQATGTTPDVDPCEKQGMHRVEINNGKSWRCRK